MAHKRLWGLFSGQSTEVSGPRGVRGGEVRLRVPRACRVLSLRVQRTQTQKRRCALSVLPRDSSCSKPSIFSKFNDQTYLDRAPATAGFGGCLLLLFFPGFLGRLLHAKTV